jgi:carboxylesterase type B
VIEASQNGQVCTQKNPMVGISGFANPGRVVRMSGVAAMIIALLSALAAALCGKRSKAVAPGSEALLGSTAASPSTSTGLRSCFFWFVALTAFLLGAGLLVFSYEHRAYLGEVLGGEDCLFLNIYAPEHALKASSKPLPVLFFVHGGDLTLGAGTDSGPAAIYGGSWALAATGKAIAVQFNYRLNVFGFLYLEDKHTDSVLGDSTNLGLLDQLAALRWVQEHIGEFGGDPKSVTIYGQSSGGTSIMALLASPLATGLFHQAFSMSGSPRIDATPKEAAAAWRKYYLPQIPECADKATAKELGACLRSLSAERIVVAMPEEFSDPDWASYLPTSRKGGPVIFMAVADGSVVVGNVSDVYAHPRSSRKLPGVPTVLGSVREECDLAMDQVEAVKKPENAAWPFTQESVEHWSKQLVNDEAFGRRVWKYYEPTSARPARERWAQLTSDMRSICGNIYNAKQLAIGQKEPVYSYIFTHRPESPVIGHLDGWPSWVNEASSQFAFHMWDVMLLFNGTAGYSKDDTMTYKFKPLDFAVGDRFRASLITFAQTGRMPSTWTPMGSHGEHVVCDIGSVTTCHSLLRKDECALFEEYDVSYDNWIVN